MTARIATIAAVLLASIPARADEQSIRESAVARAMKAELPRAMTLALPDAAKPYYVAYTVTDIEEVEVVGELGGVVQKRHDRDRHLYVDVRVGDYSLDNSNFMVLDFGMLRDMNGHTLTQDDDYALLRRQIWLATDSAYKNAAAILEKKRAALSGKATGDPVDNFSKEEPVDVIVDEEPAPLDASRFEALAKHLSAVLGEFPIHEGGVTVRGFSARRTFADSAGSFTYEPRTVVSITVACRTQAEDGMNVMNHGAVVVPSADRLPDAATLEDAVRQVAIELMKIREAPVAESYSGPVLFEGTAAAQVARELLAKNLGGTPAPQVSESRYASILSGFGLETAFDDKVGKPILPATFSVEDDPGMHDFGGTPVVGGYRVDSEGVRAQKVRLVTRGKLLGFLMSRTPRKGFAKSTGHGRARMLGQRAQISNLVVDPGRGMPAAKLRQQLLRQAKAAGLDYAIIVRLLDDPSITSSYAGGASMMRPQGPTFPKPLVVVKLSPDGKEEYLRGLELEGLTVRSLKDILAAGKDRIVHNHVQTLSGIGISFSGRRSVSPEVFPTTVVVPSLLLDDVELGEAKGPKAKPPVLPRWPR